MKKVVFLLLGIISFSMIYGQNPFRSIVYRVGEQEYKKTFQPDSVVAPLLFEYQSANEVMDIALELQEKYYDWKIELLPSGDFNVIDSLLEYSRGMRELKIRFSNLNETDFLKLRFLLTSDTTRFYFNLPFRQYTDTKIDIRPPTNELFVGEEKVFEVFTNNPDNLVIDNLMTSDNNIDYRFSKRGDLIRLHLIPNRLGNQTLTANLKLKQPAMIDGVLTDSLPPISFDFIVKEGRLIFLELSKRELTPEEDSRIPIEIEIQSNRNLKLNTTYRLVDTERAGGALIAELFTKNRLNTGSVLCDIRVYGYHRTDEGYLYIKEGNNPVFVTNIDITPKTEIEEILVQRNGKDWENDNTLYPGETVLVMLRGKGFHKSSFNFVGADVIEEDTLISSENIYELKLTVPNSINVAKVEIFDRDEPTGKFLNVKELRKPREFDFIEVELPTISYNFNDQVKPIFYESSISSVGIKFNENLIDLEELHGKQYITIDVKVRKKDGSLIELYKFEDIVVCPGPSSPRHDFYSQADCNHPDINLNNYLGTKTDNLEAWSQIEIEIAHQGNRYPGQAVQKKKIRIYNKRKTSFDLDVSFPAGLLTFESGQDQVANLSGVSFALLAQFSFYKPEGIGKLQPFKFGIGFIAIDAFNFASDQQDVGLVALGSIYPVSSERKLTFPLYAGFGWKLQDQKIFWLLGPGIQVRF